MRDQELYELEEPIQTDWDYGYNLYKAGGGIELCVNRYQRMGWWDALQEGKELEEMAIENDYEWIRTIL